MNEFLYRLLTHTVDVYQVKGQDDYNVPTLQFLGKKECLVNAASGLRLYLTPSGEEVSYDYLVTFAPEFRPEIDWVLQDGRDEDDVQIFANAKIEQVQEYRIPGKGLQGFLTYVNRSE